MDLLTPVQTCCLIVHSSNPELKELLERPSEYSADQETINLIQVEELPSSSSLEAVACAGFILLEKDISQSVLAEIEALAERTPVLLYLAEDVSRSKDDYPFSSGSILSKTSCISARFAKAGALRIHDLGLMLRLLSIMQTMTIPTESRIALLSDSKTLGQMVLQVCRDYHLPLEYLEFDPEWNDQEAIRKLSNEGFNYAILVNSQVKLSEQIDAVGESLRDDGVVTFELSPRDSQNQPMHFSLNEASLAVQALKMMIEIGRLRALKSHEQPEQKCQPSSVLTFQRSDEDFGFLPSTIVKKAMAEYGIHVVAEQEVKIYSTTLNAAHDLDYPLALKILAPEIQNKSELGGVVLNITNEDDLRRTWQQFNDDFSAYNYVLQRMLPPGIEFVVEARQTEVFGLILACGVAGPFSDIYNDVITISCPATRDEINRALRKLRCYPMLIDEHAEICIDPDRLASLLINISQFMVCNPELKVLRIDPVIGYDNEFTVVDAKVFEQRS